MPPFSASRTLDVAVLGLGLALAAVVIATAAALPPADLPAAGLGWLVPLLAAGLVLAASLLSLACLALGLRHGRASHLVGAVAAGSTGGGALVLALTGAVTGMTVALPLAGLLVAIAAAVGRGRGLLAGRPMRVVVAAGGLIVAEVAVVATLLPAVATVIDSARMPLLIGTALLAGAAALAARDRWLATAGAGVALGALALGLDRGAGIELVVGLLSLIGGGLAGLHALERPAPAGAPGAAAVELPAVVHQLPDPVLLFDGGLALRDWNVAAMALLGLDEHVAGTRLEDLLGIPVAGLPGADSAATVTRIVGDLEVRLHRAGTGVVATIAERRAGADEERLGRELRGTIEELLQARRTIELQRVEIERSTMVDPLTGVASRGAIIDRLRIEIAQARRYQHPVAVVHLDIDDFGELNARHGVAGGDALLREIALRLRLRVREADVLGRAGSDGFLAVLPHTDEAGAATFAAALRHRLAQRPIPVGDELVPITVSVGVAVMRPGEELDLDGLLARVGEALASARSAGGDRIALDRMHGLARLEERGGRVDPPAADGTT